MINRYLLPSVLGAVILSACGTSQSAKKPLNLDGSLSARTLVSGECGLFVWSGDATRSFVLFSSAEDNQAVLAIGGEEETVSLVDINGVPAQGQYPGQMYQTKDGQWVVLELTDPQVIIDGTRYKTGTLKLPDAQGWSRIIPVVGLSACQS